LLFLLRSDISGVNFASCSQWVAGTDRLEITSGI